MSSLRSPMLNTQLLCYLTPGAIRAVSELQAAGLDPDLALAVLEQLWPEEDVFSLEGGEDKAT